MKEVGVLVLSNGDDFYWYIYPIEVFREMEKGKGDWMEALGEYEGKEIAELVAFSDVFKTLHENDWRAVAAAEGTWY